MTFSEYLKFEPPAGFRDELIHGEIVLSPSANRKHADLCRTLSRLLEARLGPDYVVRLDTTHQLGEKEGPRPDVFVIGRQRWIDADRTNGYPEGSPELAVEVLSRSNDHREMATKRDLYFSDARCLEVWEVDAAAQTVKCFSRDESSLYKVGDSISLPRQIGEGSIRFESIFAGLVS